MLPAPRCCLLLGAACSMGNKSAHGCCLLVPEMWVRGTHDGKRPWWRGRGAGEPPAWVAHEWAAGQSGVWTGHWPACRGDACLGDDEARGEWVGSRDGRPRRAHGEEACGARPVAGHGSRVAAAWVWRLERLEWLGFPKTDRG